MNGAYSQGDPKRLFRLWCLLMLVAASALTWRWSRGVEIDSNILHLLPATERDAVVEEIVEQFAEKGTTRSVFLVSGLEREQLLAAGDVLARQLEAPGVFQDVQFRVGDDVGKATYDLYFPHRYVTLSPSTRALLDAPHAGTAILARARRTLYAPVATFNSELLERDPLLLFPDFIDGLSGSRDGWSVVDGAVIIEHAGVEYAMVTAIARDSAFSREAQRTLTPVVGAAIAHVVGDFPEVRILRGGALKFATEAAETAEREAGMIGIGSMLGVMVLMGLTFRSLRQLALGVLSLAAGFLCAASATFLFFDRVHLVTLGFGASLLGVCIDYSFHFFCEHLAHAGQSGPRTLRRVFAAISLGALTSAIGYAALSLSPFPGLRQMTVFSCFGLFGAYATVCCVFPLLSASRGSARAPLLLRGAGRSLGAIRALGRARGLAILGVMALVCLPALARLKTDDDIRLLQSSNAALLGEEEEVRAVVGGGDFSRFIVVEGESEDEVLERELAVRELLDTLVQREEIGAYFAVSASVPPVSQQRRDARKLATALSSARRSVDAYFTEIGFSERASSGMWSALGGPEHSALKVQAWLESPASFAQRDLWVGETSRGMASVIMLHDVRAESSLEAIEGSNVSYVNKVADISRLLRLYRTKAAGLAGFAYVAIFLFLVVRYGVRLGICASVPSVMAALSVFGVFGYLEFPLNIFHMLGLLLVLGISVDYAIFLAESRQAPNATLLAVTLSGITTLLSFGLLAWSETPFLHGFGSAVLIGVCVAFLTAPLAVLAVGRP